MAEIKTALYNLLGTRTQAVVEDPWKLYHVGQSIEWLLYLDALVLQIQQEKADAPWHDKDEQDRR